MISRPGIRQCSFSANPAPGDWASVVQRVAVELAEPISIRPGFSCLPSRFNKHSPLPSSIIMRDDSRKLRRSIGKFWRFIQINPLGVAHNLGVVEHQTGRDDLAVATIQQAIALMPQDAAAHSNLGEAYHAAGRLDEAIAAFNRAIELDPNSYPAHSNLGIALRVRGKFPESVAAFCRALELQPNWPKSHYGLGNTLKDQGLFEEAIAAYGHALRLKPDYLEAHNNLGNAYWDVGRLDEAVASFRDALRLNPQDFELYDNLILALHYHPGATAAAIDAEQENWNRHFSDPVKPLNLAHTNSPSPNRRLRIGYVSPDFWDHVVGRNLVPLFNDHDHREFEIFCYSGSAGAAGRPYGLLSTPGRPVARHCGSWRRGAHENHSGGPNRHSCRPGAAHRRKSPADVCPKTGSRAGELRRLSRERGCGSDRISH